MKQRRRDRTTYIHVCNNQLGPHPSGPDHPFPTKNTFPPFLLRFRGWIGVLDALSVIFFRAVGPWMTASIRTT